MVLFVLKIGNRSGRRGVSGLGFRDTLVGVISLRAGKDGSLRSCRFMYRESVLLGAGRLRHALYLLIWRMVRDATSDTC
jgi:hypothetical protein